MTVDIGKKIIEIMKSEDFKKLDPQGAEKAVATSVLTSMNSFYMMYQSGKKEEAFGILELLYKKYGTQQNLVNSWLGKAIGGTTEYREYITYKTQQKPKGKA